MKYRSALNRCWATVSILWIAWCLYWPFYARRQDGRDIEAEAAESYSLCLQQRGMTQAACDTDRRAYTRLDERLAWPQDQNAYQTFAGKTLSDVLSFYTLLCLFPVVFGYVLLRAVVELCVWFARVSARRIFRHPTELRYDPRNLIN